MKDFAFGFKFDALAISVLGAVLMGLLLLSTVTGTDTGTTLGCDGDTDGLEESGGDESFLESTSTFAISLIGTAGDVSLAGCSAFFGSAVLAADRLFSSIDLALTTDC